ncbi:NAD(P)H-hydrate dehydratase [Paradesulfitobacterium ferrireducens]|uniref:NAD(P)H-hydrate dehydratase n=1 Tax=Paradesulfitobacterium ferrireducens TaxID=2816476 RepID=UPI001A905E97|nr:NAD(P)H-hydrate dehydratase [Paradesulfitobacterium ferrireducens]
MRVVTAEQMRRLEQEAMNDYGIPSIILMENAALAVVQEIRQHFERTGRPELTGRKAVVLAGKGNNGGDGLAVARHLMILGLDVTVILFAKPQEFKGDAALNLKLYFGAEGKYFIVDGDQKKRVARFALSQAEVVVDAVYGTGFRGALPSVVEEYVEEVNASKAWIVAVDISSGVEADTGKVYRLAVKAHTTVTFGLPKLGHFLGRGPEFAGRVVVDPISIPPRFLESEGIEHFVLTEDYIRSILPPRTWQGHKGTHGRGVLVAGSRGMSGAAVLAGEGALRSGIGLLQMITPNGLGNLLDQALTEATVWPAPGENSLGQEAWPVIAARSEGAQALAVGPGLGQNPEFVPVLEEILRTLTLPVVLDADALNLVALDPGVLGRRQGRGSLILTPHPGEMARLCRCTPAEVQENRLELAVSKAVEWEAVVVLKGAVTIIAAPDGRAFLNPTGNPGLGTGGTGDVLTGSILGFLAQGVEPVAAACLGVYLHGLAADELAREYGQAGFKASEVAGMIPLVRHKLEKQIRKEGR